MQPLQTSHPRSATPGRWLHRYAVVAACATFPLVFAGGLVTSYDVGMAVTDWPTTKGYNMFTYPWLNDIHEAWGVFVEHSHRLLGAAVGMITIALTAWLWFGDDRRWLRWLGVVALGLVILQGVLGGVRVLRVDRVMAVVHGCLAQVFFSLMVCLALFTSRFWKEAAAAVEVSDASRVQRLALITTILAFLQLVLGAVLRHLGLEAALFAHLAVAFLVVLHVGLVAKRILIGHSSLAALVLPIEFLVLLVAMQLMLGAGAWGTSSGFGPFALQAPTGAQVFFATSHVAVGALILASCVVLTLQTHRTLTQAAVPESPRKNLRSPGDGRRTQTAPARPSFSALERRDLMMVEGMA